MTATGHRPMVRRSESHLLVIPPDRSNDGGSDLARTDVFPTSPADDDPFHAATTRGPCRITPEEFAVETPSRRFDDPSTPKARGRQSRSQQSKMALRALRIAMLAACSALGLLAALGTARGEAPDPDAGAAKIREAVSRGLGLVRTAAENYPNHRDCFSCHHQTLPMLAIVTARAAGWRSVTTCSRGRPNSPASPSGSA